MPRQWSRAFGPLRGFGGPSLDRPGIFTDESIGGIVSKFISTSTDWLGSFGAGKGNGPQKMRDKKAGGSRLGVPVEKRFKHPPRREIKMGLVRQLRVTPLFGVRVIKKN